MTCGLTAALVQVKHYDLCDKMIKSPKSSRSFRLWSCSHKYDSLVGGLNDLQLEISAGSVANIMIAMIAMMIGDHWSLIISTIIIIMEIMIHLWVEWPAVRNSSAGSIGETGSGCTKQSTKQCTKQVLHQAPSKAPSTKHLAAPLLHPALSSHHRCHLIMPMMMRMMEEDSIGVTSSW